MLSMQCLPFLMLLSIHSSFPSLTVVIGPQIFLKALEADLRKVMQPNTAEHLKVRPISPFFPQAARL